MESLKTRVQLGDRDRLHALPFEAWQNQPLLLFCPRLLQISKSMINPYLFFSLVVAESITLSVIWHKMLVLCHC